MRSLFLSCLLIASAVLGFDTANAQPFYQNFHNVPANSLTQNLNYWPSRGYNPQTLHLYRKGNATFAAGSYSTKVAAPTNVAAFVDSNGFNQWSSYYSNQGFRPRELSVVLDNSGQPRFTGIWQKRGTEGYAVWINMNDADLQNRWNSLVNAQGYRVEDHVVYFVGGQRRHAAIYVKDGKGFYEFWGINAATLKQRTQEMGTKGYSLKNLNVTEDGNSFTAIYEPRNGTTVGFYNLTVETYQQYFQSYVQQNDYRIANLRGYANGTRFLVIFKK